MTKSHHSFQYFIHQDSRKGCHQLRLPQGSPIQRGRGRMKKAGFSFMWKPRATCANYFETRNIVFEFLKNVYTWICTLFAWFYVKCSTKWSCKKVWPDISKHQWNSPSPFGTNKSILMQQVFNVYVLKCKYSRPFNYADRVCRHILWLIRTY